MNPEEGRKMEGAIKKILNAGQYKRYRQIDIQVQGPRWFMNPEAQDMLNLSEKQHDQIDEIMKNGRPPQGGQGGPGGQGGQGGPGGQQGGRGQGGPGGDMGKFADDLMKKIMSVLNENQKNKYKELTGAQFKLERPQGGPGGPGGPGGFGGGQGGPGRGGPGGGGGDN
jgi:hypothetical protein